MCYSARRRTRKQLLSTTFALPGKQYRLFEEATRSVTEKSFYPKCDSELTHWRHSVDCFLRGYSAPRAKTLLTTSFFPRVDSWLFLESRRSTITAPRNAELTKSAENRQPQRAMEYQSFRDLELMPANSELIEGAGKVKLDEAKMWGQGTV